MNKRAWVFVIAFALVWYGNGAAFIESFVNYPSWQFIGADEFPIYHQFITTRVVLFLVVPALLGTLFSIALFWLRPAAIPAWAVWIAVMMQIIVWVSTATIQLPIQFELTESGFSEAPMERLIISNFWLRRIPYTISAILFLWMAVRLLVAADKRDAA